MFLDAEYTDLLFPDLLSLALVTVDGDEHYVELDPCDAEGAATMSRGSQMVQDDVLSQWGRVPGASCTRLAMGRRTATWLLAQSQRFGQPIHIAFDHPTDYLLLVDLLEASGCGPEVQTLLTPMDVAEHIQWFDARIAAADICERLEKRRGLQRHHALADAHALRAACVATLAGKRVTV